jgi:uncharacterized protein (DUF1697 family)
VRTAPATLADAHERWARIQVLRQAADQKLAVIASRSGPDSRLARRCRDLWGDWEREALVSVLHQDHANAEVILDRGVHALRHALDLVHQDRLSEDELLSLLAVA